MQRLSKSRSDWRQSDYLTMSEFVCKACSGKLIRGYAHIHGLAITLFAVGPGTAVLRFGSFDRGKEVDVLADNDKQVAFRCLGCGAIVITPHEWRT
jgi:hypothetical protein